MSFPKTVIVSLVIILSHGSTGLAGSIHTIPASQTFDDPTPAPTYDSSAATRSILEEVNRDTAQIMAVAQAVHCIEVGVFCIGGSHEEDVLNEALTLTDQLSESEIAAIKESLETIEERK